MLKRTFSQEINEAYQDVKASLAKKGCKTVFEDPPNRLLVKHGSLWGVSPSTAKKSLDVTFTRADSGTQVTCSSRLSSDWKNITIIGCVLAAVLAGLCLWMALDVSTFIVNGKPTVWSWLVSVNGTVDASVAQAFVGLTRALALFLSVVIVLEIVVAVYAHARIDEFAQATLDTLSNQKQTLAPKQ